MVVGCVVYIRQIQVSLSCFRRAGSKMEFFFWFLCGSCLLWVFLLCCVPCFPSLSLSLSLFLSLSSFFRPFSFFLSLFLSFSCLLLVSSLFLLLAFFCLASFFLLLYVFRLVSLRSTSQQCGRRPVNVAFASLVNASWDILLKHALQLCDSFPRVRHLDNNGQRAFHTLKGALCDSVRFITAQTDFLSSPASDDASVPLCLKLGFGSPSTTGCLDVTVKMLFFPSNAFMASARSLHTLNRSKKMNCNYHTRLSTCR